MEVVVCPNCGEENPARFRLCGFCGTALAPALPPQETRKTVTIVFSDLKGSTSLGESLDPESLREVMTSYFDRMRTVLEHHGGTIEKFIGDAVMAVFGLPKLHEDDALRAVRAARGMQEALAELNEDLLARYGVTLTNRTGVNTGEVVAGDPTTGQRLVTGDAVNVAARLEQAAPAQEVLIGELTYALVRDQVQVEAVEPLELKGKAERVPAYRLVGLGRPILATAEVRETPLVGREAELAALESALRGAVEAQGARLVTVLGDAGVGKSRLIREFLDAHLEDARTLRGRCLPYGNGITFWPVLEVTRMAAGIVEDDSPEQARARIAELLDGHPDQGPVTDRIAAAIGLAPIQVPLSEIFWAVRKLFEALAAARPLIVLVDDIHSAERTFLELLEHLLDAVEGAPVLLLCTARNELLEQHPEWAERAGATRIPLAPLTDADAEAFIDRLLGGTGLSAAVRARVVAAAEGNPLFVEQMVSMLVDRGLVGAGGPDDGAAAGGEDDVLVPPSIQALLAARLDHLSREERAVVEPASVIGLTFPEPAVESLVPDALRATVPRHLEALDRKQFVRPAGGISTAEDAAYRFQHILIRDTAYQSLLKRARATLHERFVAWAEPVNKERGREQEFEEILGYHLEQAYRYRLELGPLDAEGRSIGSRGAAKLAAAGRRAFGRGDMPAAANLLRRASSLLAADDPFRIELLPDLGEALMERGEFASAAEATEEAVAAAERIGDERLAARARLARLAIDLFSGASAEERSIIEQATATLRVFDMAGDQAGLARAHRLLMVMHGTVGRYEEAASAAERVVAHATRAGDARMAARGAAGYATVALGGPTPASQVLDRCETLLVQVHGDRKAEAVILGVLAQVRAMRHEFEEARALYGRARDMLADLGPSVTAASSSIERSRVEVLAGDLVAAERDLRADDRTLEAMGEQYFRSTVAALLALVLLDEGRPDDAETFAASAQALTDEDDVNSGVLWRSARARLLVHAGDPVAATAMAEEAVALAQETVDPILIGDAHVTHGIVLEAAGAPDSARAAFDAALECYVRKEDLVSAERTRARLAALAA